MSAFGTRDGALPQMSGALATGELVSGAVRGLEDFGRSSSLLSVPLLAPRERLLVKLTGDEPAVESCLVFFRLVGEEPAAKLPPS
jgi:hypothetical protein